MSQTHLSHLRKDVTRLGFKSDGKWGIKILLYATLITLLTINSLCYLIYNWENVYKRLNGLKGLVVYIICLIYFSAFGIDWDNTNLLIKIIEEGLHKSPYDATTERSSLEHSIIQEMRRLSTIWYYAYFGYITTVMTNAIVVIIISAIQYDLEYINVDMLYLPYPFYYPENYKTLPVYFMSLILQMAFNIQAAMYAYLCTVSPLAAMQVIEGELRLLQFSVQEMDKIFDCNSQNENFVINKSKNTMQEYVIKKYLKYFVKHQYATYRKMNDVIKGLQFIAFSVSSGMAILLCTGIFIMVKEDEIMIKIQEGCYCYILIFCLYCYNSKGQLILTEDENLKNALYQTSWIDKPKFFKKSLQIILTRSNRALEIKSVGLFALNLSSFLTTVQAAYSYYSVLSNLKVEE